MIRGCASNDKLIRHVRRFTGVTLINRDLEFLKVYIRVVGFALHGIAGELTDRFATKDLRPEFDRAAFVEDLVLVFIDDGGITRRRGVEGAIGKKLVDDLSTLARTL